MRRFAPLIAVAVVLVAVTLWWTLGPGPATLGTIDARDAGAETSAPVRREVPHAPPSVEAGPDRPAAVSRTDGGEVSRGVVVVRGAWGSASGQFGRKRGPESNPEGPMALAAGPGGVVAIVDQVNRRVQRFRDGKLDGTIAIGGDTAQDVALAPLGRTVVLDRLADRDVRLYDADGRLLNEAPIEGRGIPEGGGVTGVFADDKGIYVERGHEGVVLVADPLGNVARSRDELPGRPTRDGRLLVKAEIKDRQTGAIGLIAFDRSSLAPAWRAIVSAGAPILALVMLDSDVRGNVYVGAATGHESPAPPFAIVDAAIAVVRVGPGGRPSGALRLSAPSSAEETFDSLSVDDDGRLYAMEPDAGGLSVVRYAF